MADEKVDPTISKLIDDIKADIVIVKQVVSDIKTGGVAAATKDIPQVVEAVQKQYPDVKAALPAIKAGYKTTEFWLVAVVLLGNAIYEVVKGAALPMDVNGAVCALVGVYTVCRQMFKSSATPKV